MTMRVRCCGNPKCTISLAPTKNPELAKQRQQQVLETMVKNEMLTEEGEKGDSGAGRIEKRVCRKGIDN